MHFGARPENRRRQLAKPLYGERRPHRDCERAKIASRRLGAKPVGHLSLNHDHRSSRRRIVARQVRKQRRGDPVGKVCHQHAATLKLLPKPRVEPSLAAAQCVAGDDLHVLHPLKLVAQVLHDPFVELEGCDVGGALRETPGEPAGSGPDLDDAFGRLDRGVTSDRIEEVRVDEEVLTKGARRREADFLECSPERSPVVVRGSHKKDQRPAARMASSTIM